MLENRALSEGFLKWIQSNVKHGSTILELGSGEGSAKLAKNFKVYSVEHDKEWLNKYPNVNYIYAPIKWHKPVKGFDHCYWYDSESLKKELLKIKYDVLIIDGPPANLGRSGFLKYFDIFNTDALIIMDDVNRIPEMKITRKISTKIKRPFTVMDCWNGKAWAFFKS